MKKLIILFVLMAVVIFFGYRYASESGLLDKIYENRTYAIKEQQEVAVSNLEKAKFYGEGMVTYDSGRIIYRDLNGADIWQSDSANKTNNIYITDKYIYRCYDNKIDVQNSSNEMYTVTEIAGSVINVSRENGRTCIVSKTDDDANLLYIMDESTHNVLKEKMVYDPVTCVSLDNKSDRYGYVTVSVENGAAVNNLSCNAAGGKELWNVSIMDEVVLGMAIMDGDVIVVGTGNIYYYDSEGKLMWKNSNNMRVESFRIDIDDKRIYMLYEKGGEMELMTYSMDGKVKNLTKVPKGTGTFKVYDGRAFSYDDKSLSLLHNNKADSLWSDKDQTLMDFYVANNNIYILVKDKLISGKIKTK